VYAQAIAKVEGSPSEGDTVDVLDPQDNWLGAGFYSPNSALVVRLLSRKPGEAIDAAFFRQKLTAALELRRHWLQLPNAETTGYRLVHAEGDGLPGLIVDIYGDAAVVQLLTAGMKRREREICEALAEVSAVRSIVEMPSREHQDQEGFQVEPRLAFGESSTDLTFRELGFDYDLPFASAQKTGFYFDQRENRARLETMCRGRRVLDVCCYVGAFSLAAARGGALEVLAIDRSEPALALAQAGAARAGFAERIRFERRDVKRALPELAAAGERFDVVVLDPPKLAHAARQLDRARTTYRLWNSQAMALCQPGGLLLSCSCSGAMQPADFLRTLALAAADAGRSVSLLALGEQAPDHPTPAAFQEGRYLKAAFLRVG
jgi:23S rRNA (cytosine1962-C5)-methyltransferase